MDKKEIYIDVLFRIEENTFTSSEEFFKALAEGVKGRGVSMELENSANKPVITVSKIEENSVPTAPSQKKSRFTVVEMAEKLSEIFSKKTD